MPVLRRCVSLAVLVIFLVGCSTPSDQPGGENPSQQAARTIRFVTPYAVRSLDPFQQGLWSPEWGYGELLMRATDEGTVEPWLLEEITSEDATSWRLRLRPDLTFSNGTTLDAEALAAVFERHLENNPLAKANLPGAKINIEDDRTLTLTLTEAVSNVPNLLASEEMISVFDVAAYDAAGGDPEALLGAGIYTGPFVVTALDENQLTVERNENYWGGDVALEGATVRFVPDGQPRVQAVQSGEADVALYPPTALLTPLMDAQSGPRVATAPQPLQHFRAIPNLRKAPMNDQAVRQAFAMALDYAAIAEQVLDGVYTKPIGLFPETVDYAVETQRTDLGKAAELLDQAGWVPAGDGVREKAGQRLTLTVLHYPQQPDSEQIALAMQAQLAEVGIEVKLELTDDNYTTMRESKTWDVGLSLDGTLGYSYDPVGRLRDFLTTDGQRNFGGVSSPEVDASVRKLLGLVDPEARRAELELVQREISDQTLVVIVAQRSSTAVVAESFAGYHSSSVLHHLGAETTGG